MRNLPSCRTSPAFDCSFFQFLSSVAQPHFDDGLHVSFVCTPTFAFTAPETLICDDRHSRKRWYGIHTHLYRTKEKNTPPRIWLWRLLFVRGRCPCYRVYFRTVDKLEAFVYAPASFPPKLPFTAFRHFEELLHIKKHYPLHC